jgi:alkylation response protein AidB-like acyl-CoA dehydrogenase
LDFSMSEDEEVFRRELRAFLGEHLPAGWRGMFVDDPEVMDRTRALCREMAGRGWLTMSWPEEHGGSSASVWKQTVLREEMWAHDEPRGPQYMNLNYIGPLIMRFGSDEQKHRFLPPMARGEVIWCQGFSEPDAGSDLAALRTRAERRDGCFVVNGQKIWTSYADAPAEWCLLLARSEQGAPKHAGISVFLLDMSTPGVTVRPIPTMAGPHELNEVFLDDVEIPVECLLGAAGGGWEIVRAGLAFERVGIARYARAEFVLEALVDHVRSVAAERGATVDPVVADQLADLKVRCAAARLVSYLAIALQATGIVPVAEAAVARIHNSQVEQAVGHLGLELLGPAAQLTHDDPGAPLGGLAWRQWVRNIPTTIAGGTLETQKNVVARALGLPRPS